VRQGIGGFIKPIAKAFFQLILEKGFFFIALRWHGYEILTAWSDAMRREINRETTHDLYRKIIWR
jgi:hypothetical protein